MRRIQVFVVVLILALASTSVSALDIIDAYLEQDELAERLREVHFEMSMTLLEYWAGKITVAEGQREAERYVKELTALSNEASDLASRTNRALALGYTREAGTITNLIRVSGLNLFALSSQMRSSAYDFQSITKMSRTAADFDMRMGLVNQSFEIIHIRLELHTLIRLLTSQYLYDYLD